MKTTIVVPCWNSKDLMKKNLVNVVAAKNYKKNKISEVIVVDDASSDESVKFIEDNFIDEVKLIKLTKNRGFSGAVNMGVRSAKTELVCLLNTDVSPSINFLESVYEHFENEKVFAVSLHEKNYGGATANFENGFLQHRNLAEETQAYRTFWASGGSAVFRRSVWRKLKGFDEELFSPFYWEDQDICYRAQKRGYICMWEPNARVLHNHESVINEDNFKKKYMDIIKERNELLFYWKNVHSKSLFRKHIKWLSQRLMMHPGYIRVVRAALLKYKVVKKLREREKRESTVSDEVIFASFKK